jgi:hypothetical protein
MLETETDLSAPSEEGDTAMHSQTWGDPDAICEDSSADDSSGMLTNCYATLCSNHV